jgi:hypothetical protein
VGGGHVRLTSIVYSSRLVGWLAGLLACLAGRLASLTCLAGWDGWLVWLAGWLAWLACLVGWMLTLR